MSGTVCLPTSNLSSKHILLSDVSNYFGARSIDWDFPVNSRNSNLVQKFLAKLRHDFFSNIFVLSLAASESTPSESTMTPGERPSSECTY